ncbi:MAG: DUF4397 domain-containing protein [Acidobacteriaceae bacterium]|nr:DUF4397 domain-containing protein [Acidobacteriaceae bacterium]
MTMLAPSLTIRTHALRLIAAAACALSLTGCQSIQSTAAQSAGVRFVDVSPDAPGLDFLLNKNVEVYNFGYSSYTQNYLGVSSGTYTVSVASSGSDSQALASSSLTVKSGTRYTILAGNSLANLQLSSYTDQTTAAPSGSISIRLLDQSSSVGAVDIYMVPQSGSLTTTNALYTGLTFSGNSGYLTVPSGSYTLEILPTGTVPISTTIASYSGSVVSYEAGEVRTVVLYDNKLSTAQPIQAITMNDFD